MKPVLKTPEGVNKTGQDGFFRMVTSHLKKTSKQLSSTTDGLVCVDQGKTSLLL